MNKLVGALLIGLLTGLAALGQTRPLIHSQPAIPSSEALDRLNLKMAWRIYLPTESRKDGIFSVQVPDRLKPAGQQVFIQTRSGGVIAVEAERGRTQWRVYPGSPYQVTQAVGYNSKSVFVIRGIDLFSLSRETGELQWQFKMPHAPAAPPVADEDRVYLTLGTGRIYAYDFPKPETNPSPTAPVEEREREKKPEALPELMPTSTPTPTSNTRRGQRSPYSGGGQSLVSVSAASSGGQAVRAISAVTSRGEAIRSVGALVNPFEASAQEVTGPQPLFLWDFLADSRLESAPPVTSELLLLPGYNGTFQAMSKYSGRVAYEFEAGAALSAPLGQYNDVAYVASEDYGLYALDIVAGRILWRFLGGGPILTQPAVNNDSIFVAPLNAGLYRLDRESGRTLWRNLRARRFLAANKKFVYATDASGRLLVLDYARGSELSVYDGSLDYVVPIANEVTDRMFLGANDGLLICLHDREYAKPLAMKTVELLKSEASLAESKKAAEKPREKKPPKPKPPKEDKAPAADKMQDK
jgi:outer membrane protein assembly factor BamB